MKIWKIVPLLLIPLLMTSCGGKKEKTFESVKVTKGNISASIACVGEVTPRNRIEIKPAVAGRIEKIYVNEGDSVSKGQTLALVSSTDRAALIDAARAQGPEEVKYWEDVYKASPVTAPLDGFIIKRNVEPGQSADMSSPVLVMADKLIVKVQVDETDIGKIRLGQSATIVLDSYPDAKIKGKVEHIAYESEVINNVTIYKVNVLPVSVPSFFRSGMSATVNFLQNEIKDVMVLPSNAVRKMRGNSFVFLKTGDNGSYKMTAVTTGLESDGNIEIISGLTETSEAIIPNAKMVQEMQRGGGMRPGQPAIFGGGRR